MSSKFLTAVGSSRLYPLTDRLISGLSHDEQVSRLSELGVTIVQFREKLLSSREFYQAAAAALRTARKRKLKLIINDRVDIALALRADGVHLGQEDVSPEVARRMLGPEFIIGISTHTLNQAHTAAQMPVDYVAIGPIFPTSTKKSSQAAVGLDGLRLIRNAIGRMPLVAIGGINSKSQEEVLNAGADCLAIISDIWESPGQIADKFLQTPTSKGSWRAD